MMRTNKFYNIKRFFDVTGLTNKYLVSILNSRTLGFYITYFFIFLFYFYTMLINIAHIAIAITHTIFYILVITSILTHF